MKIVPFTDVYLQEMAELFALVYSEPGAEWSLEVAKEYILHDVKNSPDYCLVALDDNGICLGGVFCKVHPYYKGKMLFIDTIQIKPEFQNQKVGKELLKFVIKKAKKDGLAGVHFLADERQDFPKKWYEKMGFQKSGWTEYEARMEDIEIGD
jgi:N-acetylglutamate synthase-like GNAT family acetyltransferase